MSFETFHDEKRLEFEPIPTEEIPKPVQASRYFGVRLPRTIPFLDCRWHYSRPKVVINNSTYSELARASLALGIEEIDGDDLRYLQRYIKGSETYFNSQNPEHTDLVQFWIKEMRREYADYLKKYRKGLVKAKPIAMALTSSSIWIIANEPSCPIFEKVPVAAYPLPRRGGRYFGVRLPRSVEFYDCRRSKDAPVIKTPWGYELWGCDRFAYKKGLIQRNYFTRLKDIKMERDAYGVDTLDPSNAAKTAQLLKELRLVLARELRLFRFACANPATRDENQTKVWKPLFVALDNGGYDILGDKQVFVTTNDL